MSTITVDAATLSFLRQAKGITEIRDTNGNIVGFFTPAESTDEKAIYEAAKRLFDPAEIERRKRDEGDKGSCLEDVWKRIHARASQ